jgi:hypothetical protein
MRKPLATAIAIAIGSIVLLGYFLPGTLLFKIRLELVHWAVILTGVAVLVGVFNLFSVHVEKIRNRQKGSVYSLFLIASLLFSFLFGLAFGPDHVTIRLLFEAVVIPVEASLMAILAVTLIYACIRLLRKRLDLMAVIFLATAFLVLLGTAPFPFGEIPILGSLIRPMIVNVPAVAGARGIILGVALGTLTTGLRILLGTDRPYGSN